VNILLKKVPALLNSLSMLNLNLCRCSLKAGGLKLPAMLKSVIENDAKLYENAQKAGKEMGIWEKAPEPFITGQMLLDMGFKPGPNIGRIIKRVFEKQLDGEVSCIEDAKKFLY